MTKYQKRELANCLTKLNIMNVELNSMENNSVIIKTTYSLAEDNKHILSHDCYDTKILLTVDEAIYNLKFYTNRLFNKGEIKND